MGKRNQCLAWGFIILAIFSASCRNQSSCEPTDDQKKVITKEIEVIVKDFFNSNTLNYHTHTALRADKKGYIMGGDGKILFTNYSSYCEGMKSSFANIQRFTEAETVAIYVYVLSNTAVTCTTEFKSKFLTTSGDTVLNNGCWTFVFKKLDNKWKVIQENGTHIRI